MKREQIILGGRLARSAELRPDLPDGAWAQELGSAIFRPLEGAGGLEGPFPGDPLVILPPRAPRPILEGLEATVWANTTAPPAEDAWELRVAYRALMDAHWTRPAPPPPPPALTSGVAIRTFYGFPRLDHPIYPTIRILEGEAPEEEGEEP